MNNLPASFKYRQLWDALTVLVLLVVAVVFIPYGELRLTYDSFDFMAASQGLETYLLGRNPDGFSYLTRAPLLPAYLHFFDNKILAAWWLNMICLTGSILMMFQIARTLNIQDFLIYPLVMVSALTYPWLLNHSFLWSEPPFILLILVLTYCLIKRKSYLIVCALCIMLFLFRKAGIFFFTGAAVWYFLNGERKNGLLISVAALLLFTAWQILEYQCKSTGSFMVMLEGDVGYKRIHYLDTVTSWVIPMRMPLYNRTIILGLTMIGILFTCRSVLKGFLKRDENKIMIIIALSYMICMIVLGGTSGYMDAERYFSVIFPLVMLLLFSLASEVHATGGGLSKIFLGALIVWMLYPLSRTISHLL